MPRTRTILIDQEALAPWAGRIDLIDAALLHHVTVRLTRRARQYIISPAGIPLVWIHYPTIRDENWLLDIADRTLQARFEKLVRLRLLIRQQVSLGRERGSRTYFGISEDLKARFEEVDEERKKAKIDPPKMARPNKIDPPNSAGACDPPNSAPACDPPNSAAQSLGVEKSKSLGDSSPPSQEKTVERGRARQGLLEVLATLPGGAERVAQIQKERGKR